MMKNWSNHKLDNELEEIPVERNNLLGLLVRSKPTSIKENGSEVARSSSVTAMSLAKLKVPMAARIRGVQ